MNTLDRLRSSTQLRSGTRRLEGHLADLVDEVGGVRGAVLASLDGRPLGAVLHGSDAGAAAAIVASSRGLGERLAELTGDGDLEEIVVRSTTGYVVLYTAGPAAVLTVLTDSSANLALLNLKAREVAAALGDAMRGDRG